MRRLLPFAALASSAILVHAGTLGYSLVWDDLRLRAMVARLAVLGGLPRVLASEFLIQPGFHLNYYRPVVFLSFWLDGLLERHGVFSYHLTNVLLHAACTVLVFALARRCGGAGGPSLAGAAVFAVHPVHVEAVAFVSGRSDLLATLFTLAAALAWVRVRSGASSEPRLEMRLGAAFFGFAMLSKEVAFVLPAVLVAWDALGVGDADTRGPAGLARTSGWLARNGGWLAVHGAVMTAVVLLRWLVAGVGFGGLATGAAMRDPANAAWTAAKIPAILATDLRLLVLPWPLTAFYTSHEARLTGLTLCAGSALVLLCLILGRRSRDLAVLRASLTSKEAEVERPGSQDHPRAGLVALVWIVLFLLPVLGVVPIGGAAVAERFLYLPSVGLSLLIALAPWPPLTSPRTRWLASVVVAVVLAVAAAATIARSRVWKDEVALFSSLVETSPSYGEAYHNLGAALGERGEYRESLLWLNRALERMPDSGTVHNSLGAAYANLGRNEEAVDHFRRAVALQPADPSALANLAILEASMGRDDAAIDLFQRALRLDPMNARALHGLAMAHIQTGDANSARLEYRALVRIGSPLAGEVAAALRDKEPGERNHSGAAPATPP